MATDKGTSDQRDGFLSQTNAMRNRAPAGYDSISKTPNRGLRFTQLLGDVMSEWHPPTIFPGDGESIWIHVLEHDGVNTHTDYAQSFVDVDGLMVHRYEGERSEYGEPWPPKDVIAWKSCDVPECSIQPGYFGNEDGRWDDYPYVA